MNIEKEKKAIERLKAFEPETEPYYLCYSGARTATSYAFWHSLPMLSMKSIIT